MEAAGAPNFWYAQSSPACDPSEPSSHPPPSVRHGTRQPWDAQAVPDRTTTGSDDRGPFQKVGALTWWHQSQSGPVVSQQLAANQWSARAGQPFTGRPARRRCTRRNRGCVGSGRRNRHHDSLPVALQRNAAMANKAAMAERKKKGGGGGGEGKKKKTKRASSRQSCWRRCSGAVEEEKTKKGAEHQMGNIERREHANTQSCPFISFEHGSMATLVLEPLPNRPRLAKKKGRRQPIVGLGPVHCPCTRTLHLVFLGSTCASCRLHCLLPGCAQGPTQHVECSALHPVSTKCRLCVIALCFLSSYLRCLVHFFLRSLLRVFFFPFPRASLSGVASEHLITFYIPEQFGLAKRWPCRPPTSSAPGSSQDLSSSLGISLRGWTQLRLLHS